MRLTTKGRFAVTAMIDVTMHGTKGPVTLAGVSDRQKISLSYLEQLFGKLRRAGLVESVRGPGGGYHLARAADTVSVADVILAVDEPIDATQCAGRESCQDDGQRCMTHELWASLNAHIFVYLRSVSLAQLVAQQEKAGVTVLHDHREAPAARKPETATLA
jgi:Rrf2 family iron-sulfur cluster assembly transcriptional regulator